MLRLFGSASFNLSLLTSDAYAIAVRAVLFHHVVPPLYFVAFGVVIIGLFVYNIKVSSIPRIYIYRYLFFFKKKTNLYYTAFVFHQGGKT